MKLNKITWKQTGLINLGILFLVATVLGARIIQTPTQTQPKAAPPPPTPTPSTLSLSPPPILNNIHPPFAKPGDIVRISGNNLGQFPTNAKITLNDQAIPSKNISAWTPNFIDITIPNNFKENQIAQIEFRVNGQNISQQAINIYKPHASPEIGVSKNGSQYQLWIKNSSPNSWLSFSLNNSPDTIQNYLENQSPQKDSDNQYQFQIPNSDRTVILTSFEPPQMKNIKLSSYQPNNHTTAYYIHPLNPLFKLLE